MILSVGRLERNKGFEVAIEALSRATVGLPARWQWAVVGAGSQADSLAKGVVEARLEEHVTFVGAVSDRELHNLYALADLFIHPTLFEGTSIVTQEAMAHALPIVASAAGGIPAKITDGKTGVLVPPGDADALSRAVLETLNRPDRGRELGLAARAAVARRLAWPAVATQLLGVLGDVAAEPPWRRAGADR